MNFNEFQRISTDYDKGFIQHHFSLKKSSTGFTIIEMLVAVALFTVVAVVSVGSILAMVDANQKARSLKSVMDNLHFALQGMTLAIQVGRGYDCDSIGDCDGGTQLKFHSAENEQVIYRYDSSAKRIERSVEGAAYIPITADEVEIDSFKFYVVGTPSDNRQPLIIMTIKGTAGVLEKTKSSFFVQTSVSPRRLDD